MSTSTARAASIDWGLGDYETLAVELEPAATHVVALAGLVAGERVLDIATGTGNAALAAARAGAATTGVDAALRLIELARQRAASRGLDVSFLVSDLHGLPLPAESFDCVISVFGSISTDSDPIR